MVKNDFRLVGAVVKTPDRGNWFFNSPARTRRCRRAVGAARAARVGAVTVAPGKCAPRDAGALYPAPGGVNTGRVDLRTRSRPLPAQSGSPPSARRSPAPGTTARRPSTRRRPRTIFAPGSATAATHHTAAWVPEVEPLAEAWGIPRTGRSACHSRRARGIRRPRRPTRPARRPWRCPREIGQEMAPGREGADGGVRRGAPAAERAAIRARVATWNLSCAGGRALRGARGPVTAAPARRDAGSRWRRRGRSHNRAPMRAALGGALGARGGVRARLGGLVRAGLAGLLAGGAPPELVAARTRRQSTRWSRAAAYALASAYGGEPRGRGRWPWPLARAARRRWRPWRWRRCSTRAPGSDRGARCGKRAALAEDGA